jgi:hypothetical protein
MKEQGTRTEAMWFEQSIRVLEIARQVLALIRQAALTLLMTAWLVLHLVREVVQR